jgi:serine/threonine protein kinase
METKASDKTNAATADAKNDPPYANNVAEYLRRYVPSHTASNVDLLKGRYRINLGAPLPEFKTGSAAAYAAEDTKEANSPPLFALVCQKHIPIRTRLIDVFKNLRHPNLLALVEAGTVEFSAKKEEYFVLVYERPAGQRLSALLATYPQGVGDYFIRERIISPLSLALQQLQDAGISHGSINPENVFFGTIPVLGDCISEPCGLSQPFYFEPLERMQAAPSGKGDGNGSQDFYALAVLTVYLMFGPQHFAPFTTENMPRLILRDGALPIITRNRDCPEIFYEFFRGMFTQNSDERWNNRSLRPWLEGKRYNMLNMPPPTETSRPFDLGKYQIHSKRELAHVLHTRWNDVIDSLVGGQLPHWVALYLRSKELAENLTRIARALESPNSKQNDSQIYELLARTVMQFDAQGPIRFKDLSMHVDGAGGLCANLIHENAQDQLQLLTRFINFSMVDFWVETQRTYEESKTRGRDYVMPSAIKHFISQFDRLRQMGRNTGLGFGIERMLYELNPDLPCLSPMLKRWHVTTLEGLLRRLDELAPTLSNTEDPIDDHIAAFICSKLSIQHEVRLHNLDNSPLLKSQRSLLALQLLSKAQLRAGNIKLPGLSHWLALRILPLIDNVRSTTMRQRLKGALAREANTGKLEPIADVLVDTDYITPDLRGYQAAKQRYELNIQRIAYYKNERTAEIASDRLGIRIASFVAYLGLCISLLLLFGGGNA